MNNLKPITDQCKYLLSNNVVAEPYLTYLDARLNKNISDRFEFGFFPNVDNICLLTDIVGKDLLKTVGLLYSKEINDSAFPRTILFNHFADQPLVMPYKDVYGNVIAIVGRSILNDEERHIDGIEKYKNTVFKKGNHLFGLYEAKNSIVMAGFAYIVEGQFDVIKAFENGITNIVALGSSSMTAFQLALLCRFTNNIVLLLDNDEAGERGRRAIKQKYSKYLNIQDMHLPEGYKDIDEYLRENNATSLELLGRE